jgi:hypothetical protein
MALDDIAELGALIEASQPIAGVQAEGSYPAMPEATIEGTLLHPEYKICYRALIHFTADQMRAFADATVAHRQQQAAAPELLAALINERRVRLLGQEPDVHWESMREERRACYAATDAAITKAAAKGGE